MWDLKNGTNDLIYKTEQTYRYEKLIAKGETWRMKDKSGAWDEHTIYKIDN